MCRCSHSIVGGKDWVCRALIDTRVGAQMLVL